MASTTTPTRINLKTDLTRCRPVVCARSAVSSACWTVSRADCTWASSASLREIALSNVVMAEPPTDGRDSLVHIQTDSGGRPVLGRNHTLKLASSLRDGDA